MAGKGGKSKKSTNGASLGFEQKLWQTADKMRNNMDAAEYKHIVLGLIFLKYITEAFEEKHAQLEADPAADPDEYLAAGIFYVPQEARWAHIQGMAKQPEIGKILDDAMDAIERENESLDVENRFFRNAIRTEMSSHSHTQ